MKKYITVFACILTMAVFTSCSKEDDTEQFETIVGKWKTDDGTEFRFSDGNTAVIVFTDNNWIPIKYYMAENKLIFLQLLDISNNVENWKKKIEEVEKELSTARGGRRPHLIDLLNQYNDSLRAAQRQAQTINKISNSIYTIISITSSTMILEAANGRINFKRID